MTITYPGFGFDITHKAKDSRARIGRLKTPHGEIETPNYIFCGTKAAIKALSPAQMREAQTDIILANTYHLMLQPGADLIHKLGGLHKFTGWDGPMLTDSGGFQVFSMGHGSVADEVKGRNKAHENRSLLEITEQGAVFKSYVDGKKILLTPESSTDIQRKLGADLFMQFDECTPYHADKDYTARSTEMSMRWGDRCLAEFERGMERYNPQGIYGIVQGGVHEDLRRYSSEFIADRPFFGSAVGGCLGGTDEEMQQAVEWSVDALPEDRPIHFLGIGRIRDVIKFVRYGIDTFDCVIPTRLARHGAAFMKGGNPDTGGETINLMNARYRDDHEPLDSRMDLPCSNYYSKAYIHHLLKAGEILGLQIIAQHNVAVINQLMREVRAAIKNNSLDSLEKEWLP